MPLAGQFILATVGSYSSLVVPEKPLTMTSVRVAVLGGVLAIICILAVARLDLECVVAIVDYHVLPCDVPNHSRSVVGTRGIQLDTCCFGGIDHSGTKDVNV